jgi:hypothetical protein
MFCAEASAGSRAAARATADTANESFFMECGTF